MQGTLLNETESEDNFEEQEQKLIEFVRDTTRRELRRNEENRREITRICKLRRFRDASDILRRSHKFRRETSSPRRNRKLNNVKYFAAEWLKYEMRCSGDDLRKALESIESEDLDRLRLIFESNTSSLHETVLKFLSLKREIKKQTVLQNTEKKIKVVKSAKIAIREKVLQKESVSEVEEKEVEEKKVTHRFRIDSLDTGSSFLQHLHLEESSERLEKKNQQQQQQQHSKEIVQRKSLRNRRMTKKLSGQKWNPPKNVVSLAQLFRVKKLIDPENTQCESFPISEESNTNLIRMLYRQYQSNQEKCEDSVKRELEETILHDMPKQILNEYQMSYEDRKTDRKTTEETNGNIEQEEDKVVKKKEEDDIDVIENWHAQTFPYPQPVRFESGAHEFLKTGKTRIPGGYLSGSEKSHRRFNF